GVLPHQPNLEARRMRASTAWLCTIVLAAPGLALAQIPPTTSVQGLLTDGDGRPLHGSVDLTLRLYAEPSGGTALWSETHAGVVVTQGRYAVQLGSVTPFASASLSFDRPLWLGVQ